MTLPVVDMGLFAKAARLAATLALPYAPMILPAGMLVKPAPLPMNTLPWILPVALIAPDVLMAVKIPTEVMFGCAASVTVAAVVAEPAVPALVAKVALATVPVTLAPVIFESNDPLPIR